MTNDKIINILAKVNEIVDYAIANDGHTSNEAYAELENMLKSAFEGENKNEKLKTAITKPFLTKTEKATIKAARRILKKLTTKLEILEENAWKGGSDETKALDDYNDALAKEHIDIDSIGCFIKF